MVRQAPDRTPAGDIDDDDAADTGVAAVGDVGDALGALTQIEAHVVEVGRGQHHAGRQDDRLHHPVGRKVDCHQLCTAGLWLREFGRRRVEHPEAIGAVGHHALHRDEMPSRVGRIGLVGRGVGIRHRLAVDQLGNRERRVVAPLREVDEDAPVGGDGHASRHRAIEGRDLFDLGRGCTLAGRRAGGER